MKGPREPLTTQSLCGKSVSDYQIRTWWFTASKQLLSLWDTRCAGPRVPVCLLLGWRLVLGWGGGAGGRQPWGPFLRLTGWGAPWELTSPTGQTPAALGDSWDASRRSLPLGQRLGPMFLWRRVQTLWTVHVSRGGCSLGPGTKGLISNNRKFIFNWAKVI